LAELDLKKLVEKKVGLSEFHEALALKADARDAVSRAEGAELRGTLERLAAEAAEKIDAKGKPEEG
jgi:hypothetical protein